MELYNFLGSADFISTNKDFSLRMDVSMLIQPLRRNSSVARRTDLKHQLERGMIWVSEASVTRLNLQISAHDASDVLVSAFVPAAGEMLRYSKLWKELGLVLTFKSCQFCDQENPPFFQLSFGIERSLAQPVMLPIANRRVPVSVQTPGSLIPPPHVDTVAVSGITIALHLMPTDLKVQPHSRVPIMPHVSEELYEALGPAFEKPEMDLTSEYALLHNRDMLENSNMEEFMEELEDLDDSQDSTLRSSAPEQQALHELLSKGISHLFIDSNSEQRQIMQGTHTLGQLPSLSKMAPSLFSPGYHTSMSQRSSLITSLVKSMKSMLDLPMHFHQDLTSSLKDIYIPEDFPSTAPDTLDILKTAFWTLAQKQLYEAEASQKLRPWVSLPILPTKTHADESLLEINSMEMDPDWYDHALEQVDLTSDYYLGTEDHLKLSSESQTHSHHSHLPTQIDCVSSVYESWYDSANEDQAAAMSQPGLDNLSLSPWSSSPGPIADLPAFGSGDDMICENL
ncbi:uncharacterized protein BP01DRAFT_423699 [Aspergillus saccharolyticus JOP 1030-1]|uniref:Uncharacterized protein n=1 Tax=Aspergillus saccharolyticus JOP 1030-1 TaxID=1450539 RepID=A0A318ZCR0_9EURO|nr:hypothetical protein BP01DRAFT_423699 [Aspergillus saccharolyticus JOP 1030-1]PYH45169.1 hypothetical protein BP01DRAFT_423699 [Aspergillus saccharolyticus JOP 1030-1]